MIHPCDVPAAYRCIRSVDGNRTTLGILALEFCDFLCRHLIDKNKTFHLNSII